MLYYIIIYTRSLNHTYISYSICKMYTWYLPSMVHRSGPAASADTGSTPEPGIPSDWGRDMGWQASWWDSVHTYIALHYITIHYITLHYITIHYITLHTYVYIYLYIHIHIYIHIYIYIYAYMSQCRYMSAMTDNVFENVVYPLHLVI
jgi:hypothetical protein